MTQQQQSRRKQQSLFRDRWWLAELLHKIICCSSPPQRGIMRGVIVQLHQRSQPQERSKETLLVLPELLILEHFKVELSFEFSISYSVVKLLGVIGFIALSRRGSESVPDIQTLAPELSHHPTLGIWTENLSKIQPVGETVEVEPAGYLPQVQRWQGQMG